MKRVLLAGCLGRAAAAACACKAHWSNVLCPDLDPGALCADAAPKAQFLAPGVVAAALLLSL